MAVTGRANNGAACSLSGVLVIMAANGRNSWTFVGQWGLKRKSDPKNDVLGHQIKFPTRIWLVSVRFGQSCGICEKVFPGFLLYVSPLLHSCGHVTHSSQGNILQYTTILKSEAEKKKRSFETNTLIFHKQ